MSRLTLKTPKHFELAITVTSYGYGRLAPNHWNADAATLMTWLADDEQNPFAVTIRQDTDQLTLHTDRKLNPNERRRVRACVSRMLRLDEKLETWFKLHRHARRRNFGRLIRSATLFEDMVKTITSCNVAWPNTVTMNAKLCEHIGRGYFPTAEQLAACEVDHLKSTCRVGYRAERIIRLAQDVTAGTLNLTELENPETSSDKLYESLKSIYGIGPYAASNILQHLGRYERVPIDSECYRHFLDTRFKDDVPPKSNARLNAMIRDTYNEFSPYAFLAYWYELWSGQKVEALLNR